MNLAIFLTYCALTFIAILFSFVIYKLGKVESFSNGDIRCWDYEKGEFINFYK